MWKPDRGQPISWSVIVCILLPIWLWCKNIFVERKTSFCTTAKQSFVVPLPICYHTLLFRIRIIFCFGVRKLNQNLGANWPREVARNFHEVVGPVVFHAPPCNFFLNGSIHPKGVVISTIPFALKFSGWSRPKRQLGKPEPSWRSPGLPFHPFGQP